MLKLIIEDDEGRKTVVPFVRDEITIGRQEGNTIRLTERNVSRRHARLVRQNGHFLIEDLGSYNGTRINGERIQGQSEIHDGDLIQIGDYDLALQAEGAATASAPAPARAAPRRPEPMEEDDAHDAGDDPDDEHDETPPPAAARQHSTAVIRMDQVEATRTRKVQNLDPEQAPRLVILSSELKGQEFSCIRTELRIGRTDDNDITIEHRSVSGTHAKVVREDNGEWRIIDMQSANGLTVNGESYAQSALKHGDIIELGHVKLRFVGAGKATGSLDAGGRSKLPMILGIVVVLAGLGAGGFMVLKPRLFPAPAPTDSTGAATTGAGTEQQAQAPQPVKPATPPEAVAAAQDPTPEDAPPPKVVEAPPAAPAIPKLAEKLAGAQEAMSARKFDQAVDILEGIKDPSGKRPAEAEQLLDEARAELLAKKGIAQANKDIDAGKLEAAASALDGVVTTAFAKELGDARAKLEARTAAAQQKAAANDSATANNKRPNNAPRANNNVGESTRFLTEAIQLIKSRQYQEAATILETCVKVDAGKADCHLWLGVAYASLGNIDKGAEQYRKFYALAPPDHPQSAKVKKLLADYDAKKKGQAANQ